MNASYEGWFRNIVILAWLLIIMFSINNDNSSIMADMPEVSLQDEQKSLDNIDNHFRKQIPISLDGCFPAK